ncbi:MAG TPA: single-stranded DNA-binding protein [Opitutaceae bacterium]
MANLNKVLLIGNLTRDPELRQTPKGTAVAQFGIAVNRTFRGEDGQSREEVTFVDLEAWGKQAETISKYMSKGRPIFIEGRLKLDQWEDKNGGGKRSKLRVVVENFQFLGSRQGGGEESGGGGVSTEREPVAPPRRAAAAPAAASTDNGIDEDVPF